MKAIINHKIFALATLLSCVMFLILGTGLLNTLVSVRAHIEGMPVEVIGLMTTIYFIGYLLGSVFIPRMVLTVGHIRTFSGFAAIASAAALVYVIRISPVAWSVLRMVSGACYAGMILVVESWLNGTAQRANRGRVLATYSMVLTGSWALSQQMLVVSDVRGFVPFLLVAMLFSLALVPLTLGRAVEPGIITATRVGLRHIFNISPVGLAGAFVSGTCVSAFIGTGPVYARSLGLETGGVALFMSATIVGGLAFQWPLGWISDRRDRRHVIILMSMVTALTSYLLFRHVRNPMLPLSLVAFVFGGTTFSFYAMGVAQVNDNIWESEIVPVASRLILVYGIGAIAGPVTAALVMKALGPGGIFVFTGGVAVAMAAFSLFMLPFRKAIPLKLKKAFMPVPRTTHAVLHLLRHSGGFFRKRGKA